MLARDLHTHLRANCPWVDPQTTVDTFKAGDPDTPVRGIAVSWMSTWAALRAAHKRGLNVFVTHEPTYWSHREEPLDGTADDRAAKQRWIEEAGMVILRCHDMLDQMPGIGIQDTWAAWLGFAGRPFEQLDAFRRIYDLEPQTLGDLARHVASRTALLGQTGLEVLGDHSRTVRKVGLGTGAIVGGTPALSVYRDHGCEVVLLTELTRWRELAWAEDVGLSLILVDHCVAEVPGLRALADHLRETFPEARVEYVPTECPTRLVMAE